MRLASRLALAALLLAAVSAQAELYRWTDSSGRVHVTDTPPPGQAKNVEKKPAPAPAAPAGEPFVVEQARKTNPITLYSTPTCRYCNDARALLNARGLPFTEKSVQDADGLDELKKFTSGEDIVPVMLVGSNVLKGFDPAIYNSALDAAGYPRAGLLPARNQPAPKKPEADGTAPAAAAAAPAPEIRGPYSPKPLTTPEPERRGTYAPKPPPGKAE